MTWFGSSGEGWSMLAFFPVITEHYLAGLNPDITFGINESIL
jgi:hypothetical protein